MCAEPTGVPARCLCLCFNSNDLTPRNCLTCTISTCNPPKKKTRAPPPQILSSPPSPDPRGTYRPPSRRRSPAAGCCPCPCPCPCPCRGARGGRGAAQRGARRRCRQQPGLKSAARPRPPCPEPGPAGSGRAGAGGAGVGAGKGAGAGKGGPRAGDVPGHPEHPSRGAAATSRYGSCARRGWERRGGGKAEPLLPCSGDWEKDLFSGGKSQGLQGAVYKFSKWRSLEIKFLTLLCTSGKLLC